MLPGRIDRYDGDHVLLFHKIARHVHHFVQALDVRTHANQQRRQLVGFGPGHLDESAVTQGLHIHLQYYYRLF